MGVDNIKGVLSKMWGVVEFFETPITSINQIGISGDTPLSVAISWGDPSSVMSIIDAGADVNMLLENSDTPLHRAVIFGNLEIIKILLRAGAKSNVKNSDGITPLDIARFNKDIIIEDLLNG